MLVAYTAEAVGTSSVVSDNFEGAHAGVPVFLREATLLE